MNKTNAFLPVLIITVLCFLASPRAVLAETDNEITQSLKQAIKFDYRFRDYTIEVAASGGKVTLKGSVESFLDKDAVEQIAKRTDGVTSVVNLLDVDASSTDDKRIASEIQDKFERSKDLGARSIQVSVDHGIVTLRGNLADSEVSAWAERVASEVDGVRSVDNKLASALRPSDPQERDLAATVQARLSRDTYLADQPINVSHESNTVTLAGEVPHLFHKEQAEDLARGVCGNHKIRNELVVASQSILAASPLKPSDDNLQQWVRDELQADPRVRIEHVNIASADGTVTLRGWVDSVYAKKTAERIARRVHGVDRVNNEMEVRTAKRPDNEIRQDIINVLGEDEILDRQKVTVAVQKGIVTLSGTVTVNVARMQALRLASRVSGVRDITNEINVKSTDERSRPTINASRSER
tara:strand:- start:835777 stop:837012 length:1236 start_codon:yes stop_codon:yes gene_type:complete